MFVLAILIGIYSYLIFILGFLNLLYKSNIVMVTLACFAFGLVYYFKYFRKIHFRFLRFDLIPVFLIALISIQLLVNLIGVLSPELAFDALWYHLTLPKIYLSNNSIFHIPGGLFYYSDMPKLTEMLYISALSFKGETLAKLIHLLFGFLTLLAIYKISRKFFSRNISLLAVVVFLLKLGCCLGIYYCLH
ncbi:MAG: hypothetical protein M1326_07200 [Cyanobacteria bacterium]|nr:hypothetical protein [Cyanobacteriota bacterium]